jgi:hypothetical protein
MDRAAGADSGRRIGFGGYKNPLEEDRSPLAGLKRKVKGKKKIVRRDGEEEEEHKEEQPAADVDAHEKRAGEAGDAPADPPADANAAIARQRGHKVDADANAGSDYDAMPDTGDNNRTEEVHVPLTIPNSAFRPARILVNPRCVTTYAGVAHAQLALDLFGPVKDMDEEDAVVGKYVLEDWEGAPESFVCQEQK